MNISNRCRCQKTKIQNVVFKLYYKYFNYSEYTQRRYLSNRKKKVMFFGTGDFALPTLDMLNKREDIGTLEVVTSNSKVLGKHGGSDRSGASKPTVIKYCKKNHLKVYEIVNNTPKLDDFIDTDSSFDLGIVVSFGHFLPGKLIRTFLSGAINVHPSALPMYRGAAPIEWAILNGDKSIGLSIIDVDPGGFDKGNIYKQSIYNIGMNDTRDTVSVKLAFEGSKMVNDFIENSSWSLKQPNKLTFANISMVSQNKTTTNSLKIATKFFKQDDSIIPWNSVKSGEVLYNRWRALSEHIGCWTRCVPIHCHAFDSNRNDKKESEFELKFKILEPPIQILSDQKTNSNVTCIHSSFVKNENIVVELCYAKILNRLLIYHNVLPESPTKFCTPCKQIQIKGKNSMSARAFANGYMKKEVTSFLLYNSATSPRQYSTVCNPRCDSKMTYGDFLHEFMVEFETSVLNILAHREGGIDIKRYNSGKPIKFGVALSGGPDSTALLFLLNKLFLARAVKFGNSSDVFCDGSISVIIVDHGLRNESGFEAEYVHKLHESGDSLKIFFVSLKEYGAKCDCNNDFNCDGSQEWARNARYCAMRNICDANGINILITGHHSGDQVETNILRLFRGSGNYGLRGIDSVALWNNNFFVARPLLNFKKNELYFICETNQLNYINDPSNINITFDRVRIRNALREYNCYKSPLLNHQNIFIEKQNIENNIGNSVNSIVSFMSAQKVYTDEVVFNYISQSLASYSPKLGFITVCINDFINGKNDFYVQMKALKKLIQKINNDKYLPLDKQCKVFIQQVCDKHKRKHQCTDLSVNIKKCIVDVKYNNVYYPNGLICIRRSPPIHKKQINVVNFENFLVRDWNGSVQPLLIDEGGGNGATTICWDECYDIYLSNDGTILTVEHNKNKLLMYQLSSEIYSRLKNENINMQYGIGVLPKCLTVKTKTNQFNTLKVGISKTEKNSGMRYSFSYPKWKTDNFIRPCFGLYCIDNENVLNNNSHAKYWRLIGIPQINVR
jgi:tRNA(Ile)-lysidine synthetase-like protein